MCVGGRGEGEGACWNFDDRREKGDSFFIPLIAIVRRFGLPWLERKCWSELVAARHIGGCLLMTGQLMLNGFIRPRPRLPPPPPPRPPSPDRVPPFTYYCVKQDDDTGPKTNYPRHGPIWYRSVTIGVWQHCSHTQRTDTGRWRWGGGGGGAQCTECLTFSCQICVSQRFDRFPSFPSISVIASYLCCWHKSSSVIYERVNNMLM